MGLKRARKLESAAVATLSNYLEAVLTKSGVTLLRDKRTVWLSADEMERLCAEWTAFRSTSSEEPT